MTWSVFSFCLSQCLLVGSWTWSILVPIPHSLSCYCVSNDCNPYIKTYLLTLTLNKSHDCCFEFCLLTIVISYFHERESERKFEWFKFCLFLLASRRQLMSLSIFQAFQVSCTAMTVGLLSCSCSCEVNTFPLVRNAARKILKIYHGKYQRRFLWRTDSQILTAWVSWMVSWSLTGNEDTLYLEVVLKILWQNHILWTFAKVPQQK